MYFIFIIITLKCIFKIKMRKTIEDIFLLWLVNYQGFYLSGLKKTRGGGLGYSKKG